MQEGETQKKKSKELQKQSYRTGFLCETHYSPHKSSTQPVASHRVQDLLSSRPTALHSRFEIHGYIENFASQKH